MQKDLPLHLIAAHEAKLTPPIGDLALNHLQKHEMAASNLKSRRSPSGKAIERTHTFTPGLTSKRLTSGVSSFDGLGGITQAFGRNLLPS